MHHQQRHNDASEFIFTGMAWDQMRHSALNGHKTEKARHKIRTSKWMRHQNFHLLFTSVHRSECGTFASQVIFQGSTQTAAATTNNARKRRDRN